MGDAKIGGGLGVVVARDLEDTIPELKKDAMALRKEIGGMDNAARAAIWGRIGDSNTAPDFFDGKINPNDQNAFMGMILAGQMKPTEAFGALAEQGSIDPGIGTLQRRDKIGDWLDGSIASYAVIQGTRTREGNGDGAKLGIQLEYKATKAETLDVMGDVLGRKDVKFDTEGGKPQNLKARFNVNADIKSDGIYNIHLTGTIEGVPAVDALKLIKEIGDEEVEFPLALPLKIMMDRGADFSVGMNREGGAHVGIKASLGVLEEMDDRIPDAMLSAEIDGKMEKIDGRDFFNTGELDVSLDSKMNVRWDDAGKITVEYQDADGKFQAYPMSDVLGFDPQEDMILAMLGLTMSGPFG